MGNFIQREQVRALLHVASTPGTSVSIPKDLLPELCRRYLAIEDAPVGSIDFHCENEDGAEMCEFSVHSGYSKAKKLDGKRVRIVAVPPTTEGGHG